MKPFGFIYKTTCICNGKIYIGQSTKWNNGSYLGSGVMLIKAIKVYGREQFKRKLLKICFTQKQLDAWELIFIKKYDSTNKKKGYNILKGTANNFGSINPTHLPEVIEKINKKKKGKWSGENSYYWGKKLSEETKKKISDNKKKTMKGSGNPMYGRKHTEETKEKLRQKRLEYYENGGTAFNKGKHLSEETKEKLRQAAKRQFLNGMSKETKLKISKTLKRNE
jgi:group I intron endonuclease